ncbi:MAG: MBL fold metallo-hydrolase, partial [Fibrobacterota bacterium]
HSTWDEGFNVAVQAGVKTLVVFHHDPARDDDALDTMHAKAVAEAMTINPGVRLVFASEGLALSIGEKI